MSEAPVDDTSVPDDCALWRRIPPNWWVLDENRGVIRPASACFDDNKKGPMSVYLSVVMAEHGLGYDHVLAGHEDYKLASVTAGLARELNQAIVRKPEPDQPAHAEVVGKKTGSVKNRFARDAVWLVAP